MTIKLVKSDCRNIGHDIDPEHIVAYEIYMLHQLIARVSELARLYPEIMAVNILALSDCFAAFAEFFATLSRRK